MTLPSFTVTPANVFDLLGNTSGGAIVGTGLGAGVPAQVTFTSNVPGNALVTFGGNLYKIDEVIATVGSDGSITRNGAPVQLLANDAGLSVQNLQWGIRIGSASTFWVNAPTNGGTLDLSTVVPVPNVPVTGTMSIFVGALSDATTYGKGFLTGPVDAATARAYLGVPSGEAEYYANLAAFPGTGAPLLEYVAEDTGKIYRWNGSTYIELSAGLPTSSDLSSIATANPTTANVPMNNKKITGLANGTASTDAAAFGQIPTVVDHSDGTIAVGSVTSMEPLPLLASVITTNTAPTIGKTNYYNASGGNLTPPFPALSGLNVGARFAVRRDPVDTSTNTVTLTCAGADTFYSSGSTTATLPISGEQREYIVVQPGGTGTKFWAPAGPINPVAGLDKRYLQTAPVAIFPSLYYANLQAAINACNAAGGGVVQLPEGPTSCSAKISMLSNVIVAGPPSEWSVTTAHMSGWLEFDNSTTDACIEFPTTTYQAGLHNVSITGVGGAKIPATRAPINMVATANRNGNRLRNVTTYGGSSNYLGQNETRVNDILAWYAAGDGIVFDAQDCSCEGNIVVGYNGGNGITLTANSGPIRMGTVDTFFNGARGIDINGSGHRISKLQSNNNGFEGVRFYNAANCTIIDPDIENNGRDYTGAAGHTTRYANVNFAHPTAGNIGCALIGGLVKTSDPSGAPLMSGGIVTTEAVPSLPTLIGVYLSGYYFVSGAASNAAGAQVQSLSSFQVVGCTGAPDNRSQQSGLPHSYRDYGSGVDQLQWGSGVGSVYSGVRSGGAFYKASVSVNASASSGAPTLDMRTANIWHITLNQNVTSTTVTNLQAGQEITIRFIQDATGGRTYVWPTNCKLAGNAAPTPTTTPNRVDSVTFVVDSAGTNLLETSRAVDVQNINGNAATATKWATARKINGVALDGTADIMVYPSVWQPQDEGLIAWAFDPAFAYSGIGPSAGFMYMVALPIRYACTITNIVIGVATVGSGLTSGQNFAMLYSPALALLSTTADQTSNWGSGTGRKTMALSTNGGAQAITTPGVYYVGVFSNGTTPPKLFSGVGSAYVGAGADGSPVRFGYDATHTGLTTTPPSTAASPTAHAELFWAAVS